jgi:hypothetical protein
MAAKLARLTHKIPIPLHLVAENYTICSSRSRRPFRKLLDTPSYFVTATDISTDLDGFHLNAMQSECCWVFSVTFSVTVFNNYVWIIHLLALMGLPRNLEETQRVTPNLIEMYLAVNKWSHAARVWGACNVTTLWQVLHRVAFSYLHQQGEF